MSFAWPKDEQSELLAFYGNPGTTHRELVIWESANLVYVPARWRMVLAWDPKIVVPALRVHRKCADALGRALDDVWNNVARRSQAEIERMKVHLYGGSYVQRTIRGGRRISTHGFGCGSDWNPVENKMHTKGNMDQRFRASFEKEGAIWLSHDPMHVQFAMSPKAMPRAVLDPRITGTEAPPKLPLPARGDDAWIAAAVPLIKRWEGFEPKRYYDVKQWAIGYGTKADHLPADTVLTEPQAAAMLADYLHDLRNDVAALLRVEVNANQGGALLSFAYNLGVPALARSTLLTRVNAGDFAGAGKQFGRWVKAAGRTMPGLVKRRADEAQLFLSQFPRPAVPGTHKENDT